MRKWTDEIKEEISNKIWKVSSMLKKHAYGSNGFIEETLKQVIESDSKDSILTEDKELYGIFDIQELRQMIRFAVLNNLEKSEKMILIILLSEIESYFSFPEEFIEEGESQE